MQMCTPNPRNQQQQPLANQQQPHHSHSHSHSRRKAGQRLMETCGVHVYAAVLESGVVKQVTILDSIHHVSGET